MLLSREQLISCSNTQRKLVQAFKKELATLEKGKLTARYRNTRVELYHVIKEQSELIEKRIYDEGVKATNIGNQLRRRWCIEKSIAILERNIDCIEKNLKSYNNFDPFFINESMPKAYKTNKWIFDGIPSKLHHNSNLIINIDIVKKVKETM